jgi:hypothetical protein
MKMPGMTKDDARNDLGETIYGKDDARDDREDGKDDAIYGLGRRRRYPRRTPEISEDDDRDSQQRCPG